MTLPGSDFDRQLLRLQADVNGGLAEQTGFLRQFPGRGLARLGDYFHLDLGELGPHIRLIKGAHRGSIQLVDRHLRRACLRNTVS